MRRYGQDERAGFAAGAYNYVRDLAKHDARRIAAYMRFSLVFAAPDYTAFGKVIRAHFQLYVVALYNADMVHTELTRNICGNYVTVGKFDFEVCVGQAFYYFAFRFYHIVF